MSSCYCAFWWTAWGIVAICYQFLGSWRMFHSLLHRVCSCITCSVRHGWLPLVWLKRSYHSLILFLLARLGGCSRIHMCCPSALVRPWAFNEKKRNRIVDFQVLVGVWTQKAQKNAWIHVFWFELGGVSSMVDETKFWISIRRKLLAFTLLFFGHICQHCP